MALLGVVPAQAATITFEVNPSVSFQQTVNNPCVIGDPSCKEPAGMDYTVYPGTPPATNEVYDAYSPSYTYTELVGFLSGETSFRVGIDVNYSVDRETLSEFTVWYCPTNNCTDYAANAFSSTSSHDAELLAAGYQVLHITNQEYLLETHNGNGFSDALSSLITLTDTTALYLFEARQSNDNDGMEEFFLIPASAPPIPEPTTMLLFGTGLVGLAARARRQGKS